MNEINYDESNPEIRELEIKLKERLSETAWTMTAGDEIIMKIVGNYKNLIGPNGINERKIAIFNISDLQFCINSDIHQISLLPGIEGYYNPQNKKAEVGIASINSFSGYNDVWYKLFNLSHFGSDEQKINTAKYMTEVNGINITIQRQSDIFKFIFNRSGNVNATITFENLTGTNLSKIKEIIETISNSLFMDLDSVRNCGVYLARTTKSGGSIKTDGNCVDFSPRFANKYQKDVIDIYWLARSADRIPVFQFLAYYQILEYYFPKFAQISLRQRITGVLKDPNFTPHDDDSVNRIMGILSRTSKGSLGLDEQSMLRNVLFHCIDAHEIRGFINNSSRILEEITSKRGISHKVEIEADDEKFFESLSARIYNLRCRIVHAKGDQEGKNKPLLPFSDESGKLKFDIFLMQELSQRVIASNAVKFSLE